MNELVIQPGNELHVSTHQARFKEYAHMLSFHLNGKKVTLATPNPEDTLLDYLRNTGLTGTKLGCAEGGCGACTVVVSQINLTTKQIYSPSVNACLAPLVSVDGKHVITIEGIGTSKNPHAAQKRIANRNGSQCGFCTPGIVMSLYSLLQNKSGPTSFDIEEAFDGNLCRCTGYRPILDAAQSFRCVLDDLEPHQGKDVSEWLLSPATKSMSNEISRGEGCSPEETNVQNGNGANPGICYDNRSILQSYTLRPLKFGNNRRQWFRPVTVKQILEIKNIYPSAKVISGSTESQIEVTFKGQQFPLAIYVGDVAELRQYHFYDDYVEIGGNVTLTDLEDIMKSAEGHYGKERGQVYTAVLKQLRYFAGRQIRNAGTPAGNLATASPISDLNPVFMASNAIIATISPTETKAIPATEFFKGYRTTVLSKNAIILSIRIPTVENKASFFRAYKQAKRKEDDIAIVNAAFYVILDGHLTITDSRLAYGGMAPSTVLARKAAAFLRGKKFCEMSTLEGTIDALEQDFSMRFGVPGGMATYRRSLAIGFFYRFYHDVLSGLQFHGSKTYQDFDAVDEIQRQVSSGMRDGLATQAYSQRVLGRAYPHVAALKQCTGEAQYTDDIPVQNGELYGSLVLSTKARARLLTVDVSSARTMQGVAAWIDHRDLSTPEANWWGVPSCDELFLAVDEVFTAGQPIGLVLADTPRQAREAARAVKISYEELPAILTIEDAIEAGSFFEHRRSIVKGDVSRALEEADHVFTGVSRIGGQEHFYLESQACLVVPKPEDGEMEVYSSTQNPTETQTYVSQVTGAAANKVVVRVKRLGGGFGGKETRSIQLTAICALAAQKVRRPVRCMLNRDEDIITSGQRHPFLAHWKVGVSNQGKLAALEANIYANGGWSQDLSAAVVDRALAHIDGVYNIPNVNVEGRIAKTNTVSNTAFRGFGGPQGMFIAECYMSEVADHLNVAVESLRDINMYKPNEITHFNQQLTDWHVPLMYKQVQEESSYQSRRTAIDSFNESHKWRKRGLALIPTKFGISFTALFLNQAGALVHIYQDGSVLLAHGGTEMGQGLHTKMIMVAAEALKISPDNVYISETSTNTVANTSATAASASSDLNGYAIWNACEQLNSRLSPYRLKFGQDAPLADLARAAYLDRVNLSAQGFYSTPDIGYVWGENKGQMFFYFTQGVAAAEVEIDTLTGDWSCRRADVKMDVGKSINPAIDYGQIEGAFVQGQGLFTTEEMLWMRSSGEIATRGPGNYKIPGFRDIPQVFNVSMLKDVEWETLRTIQRSRGVGEPPLFLASSVFFAIRDALKAAREQWGCKEVLQLWSPATSERIRLSCADHIIKKSKVEQTDEEAPFFVTI